MSEIKSNEVEMNELLQLAVDENASDLHLNVNSPPVLRIHGGLHSLETAVLTGDDTERLMKSITSPDHQQRIREQGGTDFGFGFGDAARFRVSVLKAKGNIGLVLRLIPSKFYGLEEIGLPVQVKELLFRPRGLILVTGPTGSGKSTTLASMVNVINEERDCHIITIEDPIEYFHTHKKSLVTQREIGVDVPTFKESLKGLFVRILMLLWLVKCAILKQWKRQLRRRKRGILCSRPCIPQAQPGRWIVLLMLFLKANSLR